MMAPRLTELPTFRKEKEVKSAETEEPISIIMLQISLYEHNKDFAKHLLAILMGNALLYTLAYVVLKLAYRERIPVSAWIWLALAHVTWVVAGYLFLSAKTKWSETPAQSRTHNEVCSALRVFDSHDLWHLASAVAMFCSFNALLVLDEPLNTVPRRLIPVF